MKQLIEIEDVGISKGSIYRLKNINLRINQGDKIALLGKSGAGKSSLISVVNGSLKSTKGVTKWKGQDLRSLKSRQRREIATLWQDLRLIEELDVEQNINTGALGRHNFVWAISNLLGIVKSNKSISCLKTSGLSRELIHAYGPSRKVLIMPIKKTIKLVKDTANLEVKKMTAKKRKTG